MDANHAKHSERLTELGEVNEASMKAAEAKWSELKNQSIDQQKTHHEERTAKIVAGNKERERKKKETESEIKDEIKEYTNLKADPKVPAEVDFSAQEAEGSGQKRRA